MKYVKIVLGAIAAMALLVGCIWILQGVNVLPGSFMTGDLRWAYRGAAVAIVAAAVLYWVLRTPGLWRGVLGSVGVLFMVGGTIWILQGLNIVMGSPMTGDIRWSYRGAIMAVIGLAMLIAAVRRRTPVVNGTDSVGSG